MKRMITVFCLLLVVIAASWSLYHPQFFRVHDYVHAARVIEMYRGLMDGHFPVRWSQNFGFGYGMPLFEFYAPLPYYSGAGFHWLGLSVLTAVKLLFLYSTLFTAWGSYKLGREFFGRVGGILTAAAITLAPYRAVNLFVRGALSEAWGIMAMPWVLLFMVRLIKQRPKAWRGLTLSLVVLMLSHNIMTMLFVPLSLVFAVLYLGWRKWIVHHNKNSELKTMLRICGSLLLAVGLSSFYLLPAVLEKDLTQVGKIFGGYFHYSHHFLYIRQFFQLNWGYEGSAWGPDDQISFFLGWGQLMALGGAALLLINRLVTQLKNHRHKSVFLDRKLSLSVILGVLLGLSLFMSILKSKPLWDVLPGLSFTQFPWRFLGIGIIFLGLLVGLSASLVQRRGWRYVWFVILFGGLLANYQLFKPKEFLSDAKQYYYTDPKLIQRQMSGILPDYIPLQMAAELTPPTALAWCEAVECDEQIEVLVDRTHENLIRTKFSQPQTVQLAVAYFPGWKVELDGQKIETTQSERGNLEVTVPAGEHLIGSWFESSPIRWWSDALSLVSWGLFIFLVLEPSHNSIARS